VSMDYRQWILVTIVDSGPTDPNFLQNIGAGGSDAGYIQGSADLLLHRNSW
jgi:hypothetical protein